MTGRPRPPARRAGGGGRDSGQAAVELVLVVPLVMVLALAVVQLALVARDQVLVTHAAREGARQAAVEPDAGSVRAAALAGTRLDAGHVEVEVGHRGDPGGRVRVEVRYRSPTDVPLVGALVGAVDLSDSAVMRVER
jgi:hypothetical protein